MFSTNGWLTRGVVASQIKCLFGDLEGGVEYDGKDKKVSTPEYTRSTPEYPGSTACLGPAHSAPLGASSSSGGNDLWRSKCRLDRDLLSVIHHMCMNTDISHATCIYVICILYLYLRAYIYLGLGRFAASAPPGTRSAPPDRRSVGRPYIYICIIYIYEIGTRSCAARRSACRSVCLSVGRPYPDVCVRGR